MNTIDDAMIDLAAAIQGLDIDLQINALRRRQAEEEVRRLRQYQPISHGTAPAVLQAASAANSTADNPDSVAVGI